MDADGIDLQQMTHYKFNQLIISSNLLFMKLIILITFIFAANLAFGQSAEKKDKSLVKKVTVLEGNEPLRNRQIKTRNRINSDTTRPTNANFIFIEIKADSSNFIKPKRKED